MRILHAIATFAPAWQYGGPVRSTFELCRALVALGHRVCVVTTTAGTQYHASDEVVRSNLGGIEVHYCPARVGRFGIQSPGMAARVRELAPGFDVAHLTGVWQPTSRAVAAALVRAGLPYASSPRGALSPYSFSQGWLKKRIYFWAVERGIQRRASALHVTAPLEEQEVQRLGLGVPTRMIANVCSTDQWFPDAAAGKAWRRRVGVGDETFVITHVGRIQQKKNLEFLPLVARELHRRCVGRPWRFVLHGPVAARDAGYLRRLRAAFPDGTLACSGESSDAADLRGAYSGSDCTVMPSHHENFGNAAVESVLCGTPLVASEQVGAASMLVPLGAALVVENSAGSWAGVLEAISLDGGSRRIPPAMIAGAARLVAGSAVASSFSALYSAIRRRARN